MGIWEHTFLTLAWTMAAYYIGSYRGRETGWILGSAETIQMMLDKKYITVDDINKMNNEAMRHKKK